MYIFVVKSKSTDDENYNLSSKISRLSSKLNDIWVQTKNLEVKIGEN